MISALLALALVAAPKAPADPAGDPVERRRAEVARDLVRLGEELRRELVAGDAKAIGARVPAEGLRCGGRLVPRSRVQRDLSTPGSWLHDTLLGVPGHPGAKETPASLAELLRAAGEVAIAVTFVHDVRAEPLGRPCLEFRAKGVVGPTAPLCFERQGGRWWFTESLYPCG